MPQVRSAEEGQRYVFDLSLPVTKVMMADLDGGAWHQWLLQRLGQRWPHIGAHSFRSHTTGWMNSNEHRFMRCGMTVALAARWQDDPIGIVPVVKEVFVFTPDKQRTAWRNEMRRLYREMQIWAATMNAGGVKIGNASDLTVGRLTELVGADQEIELWLEPQRQ